MIDELQNLDFSSYKHSIVYAPNSTGKTRLTRKLLKKYENEPAMFFTSSKIADMLSFTGRKIFVGSDSSKKTENERIVKDFNKTGYGDTILQMYGVKNASALAKKSFLFKTIGLKKKDSFEIYSRLVGFLRDAAPSLDIKLNDLITVDQKLSTLNLDEVKGLALNIVSLSLDKNGPTISQETRDKLEEMANSINSSQNFCPLCGQRYKANGELKKAIESTLKEYSISATAKEYELCVNFLNALNKMNDQLRFRLFKCEYQSNISADLLLSNLSIIDNCAKTLASMLVEKIDSYVNRKAYNQYLENQKIIIEEEKLRKNSSAFCRNVVEIINELITLPDGFRFRESGDKVELVDSFGQTTDAKEFLSESEQKRMCISIAFAEIKQRSLKFIVFDDPVDSNDDYFFDLSANVIGDLLLKNESVDWMVLTHEFRLVSILSDRCRNSSDSFCNTLPFLFYLPDPSFHGGGMPPFSLITMSPDQLGFLLEHETIVFRKIFTGVIGYNCDKELALLSSFNTARNLYNDILENHKVAKHELKALRESIGVGNQSFEHYKSGGKKIMRMSTLSKMNKIMYCNVSPVYFSKSKVYAANYRVKYVNTAVYSSIKCDNNVLKYILFAMTRVMNSHYLFEKKLFMWARGSIGSFSQKKFEKTKTLWKKLGYVKSICPVSLKNGLATYEMCFGKWRGLLNDFAHSPSRMIPPYLTVSPIEMYKLEEQIKALP